MRTPDEIMTDFDLCTVKIGDIDPREILWEIIEDVIDSAWLACSDTEGTNYADEIKASVIDYVTNHYGDD